MAILTVVTTISPLAARAEESPAHRFALGGTSWSVWRDALLRTTGFPAAWVDRLAGQRCAAVADAYLAGAVHITEFDFQFAATLAESAEQINLIAEDTRLREAITWQNPAMVGLLDSLRRSGPPKPRNSKRRYREVMLARFWQRYCTKTETIGFFGPALWIRLDPATEDVRAVPGDSLLARRKVFLEPWALTTYASVLAGDPRMKPWLPPSPMPHYLLDGRCLRRPGLPPVQLSAAQAAALSLCDGRRSAVHVVTKLIADPTLKLSEEDGYRLLDELVSGKLLRWDANLPLGPQTEGLLEDRIGAIGQQDLRYDVHAGLELLRAAKDEVAAAAGDPASLAAAMTALENTFTELTGREPRRRPGQTYAGRGICYEDTTRDLDMIVGRRILDAIAPPMAVVLQAARWLTSELGSVYEEALQELFNKTRQDNPQPTLADLWYPAIDLFWGDSPKPVDRIEQALTDRWAQLFELSAADTARNRLEFTAEALADRATWLFPADRPGWSWARVHSPDLIICARSLEAVNNGDFSVVLGELHLAYAPMSDRWCTWSRDEPDRPLQQTIEDFGRPRIVPLFPAMWSRDAGRNVQIEDAPTDWHIGFAKALGVDTNRVIPIGSVPVFLASGRLMGTMPNGENAPLIEFFAYFLSATAVNMFRGLSADSHSPRVSIDRLVLFRETWRVAMADLNDLLSLQGDAERYLAGRRLVARLRLPNRCFVKIATERKPVYVDFTSPLYVASLCTMMRAARDKHGSDIALTIAEMLPTPDQTWIPDAAGNHYFGEIRLHITDPELAATATGDAQPPRRAD